MGSVSVYIYILLNKDISLVLMNNDVLKPNLFPFLQLDEQNCHVAGSLWFQLSQ